VVDIVTGWCNWSSGMSLKDECSDLSTMVDRVWVDGWTLIGGEAALRRGKGGDNASWVDANLTRSKNKKNSHGRFSWYKWTVKI
jgi:hypothetical protein